MLSPDDSRRMYAYNRRVLEVYLRKLERLPWSVVSKDRGVTWHSMAGVFKHILGVYDGWLNYVIQGASADPVAWKRPWKSLGAMQEIRPYFEAVWARADRLLDGLTEASLRRKVKAPWQPKACPLADALMQVTLEQAHHLGEIIAMLWQEDIRPPEMTWLGTNWALEAEGAKRGAHRRAARKRNA